MTNEMNGNKPMTAKNNNEAPDLTSLGLSSALSSPSSQPSQAPMKAIANQPCPSCRAMGRTGPCPGHGGGGGAGPVDDTSADTDEEKIDTAATASHHLKGGLDFDLFTLDVVQSDISMSLVLKPGRLTQKEIEAYFSQLSDKFTLFKNQLGKQGFSTEGFVQTRVGNVLQFDIPVQHLRDFMMFLVKQGLAPQQALNAIPQHLNTISTEHMRDGLSQNVQAFFAPVQKTPNTGSDVAEKRSLLDVPQPTPFAIKAY